MDFCAVNKNILIEPNNLFGDWYNQWRLLRVCKLEQIFGIDWFKGKRILELGCGYGNIGLYFKDLGADVTFADARQEFLDVVKRKCQTANTVLIDQDKEWDLNKKFDLIIHFGVLYNIKNWKQDLACALKQTQFLALETAVNRFAYDIEFEIKNFEYGDKHCGCFNNQGSLPSISLIEKELIGKFNRYDDADLNCGGNLRYTLICNDQNKIYAKPIKSWHNNPFYGGRKFWIIDKR